MTRGYGWRFLDMGRRLERALATTALVRSALTVATPVSRVLASRLELADFGDLGRPSGTDGYAPLFSLIDVIDERLRGLSDALAASYFSHAEVRVSQ